MNSFLIAITNVGIEQRADRIESQGESMSPGQEAHVTSTISVWSRSKVAVCPVSRGEAQA